MAPVEDLIERMHAQTLVMIEAAHDMGLQQGTPRPTVDPDKLIAAADRLQKLIEKENNEREERLKQLADTEASLNAAFDRLHKAIADAETAAVENVKRVVTTVSAGIQQDTDAPAKASFRKRVPAIS